MGHTAPRNLEVRYGQGVGANERAAVFVVLISTALIACSRPEAQEPAASPKVEASSEPRFEWSGCTAELPGPTCGLGPEPLTLWIPPSALSETCPAPQVFIDGNRMDTPGERLQGGWQVRWPPDLKAQKLTVRGCETDLGTLRLRPDPRPRSFRELERLRKTQPSRALELLGDDGLDITPLALRDGLRARIVAATAGLEEAQPLFAKAVTGLAKAGWISEACDLRTAWSYYLREGLHLAEAERILREGRECLSASPRARALWPYFEATLALESLDLRRALDHLEEGLRRQRRLGLEGVEQLSRQQRARVLADLGRFTEAENQLRHDAANPRIDDCHRAYHLDERAWTAIRALEAGASTLSSNQLRGVLDRALKASRTCPKGRSNVPNLLTNRAFAMILEGRASEAKVALTRARQQATRASFRLGLAWSELDGRIALLEGRRRRAEKLFQGLRRRAEAAGDDVSELRAALGLGAAFASQGRRRDAIRAYRAGERSLDRMLHRAPFGEGRAQFLEVRGSVTALLLAELLDAGELDEALRQAHRNLRRVLVTQFRGARLDGLDQEAQALRTASVARYQAARAVLSDREVWRLSQREMTVLRRELRESQKALEAQLELPETLTPSEEIDLGEPAEGTLRLTAHTLPEGSWVFFAERRGALPRDWRVQDADLEGSREGLAEAILKPIEDWLAPARSLEILWPSALARVDLHALPYRGASLVAHLPVLYRLGVSQPPRAQVSTGRPTMVLGDLGGGLAAAKREVRSVRALLAAREGEPPASLPALLNAVSSAGHLHYAGHGRSAGYDAEGSALVIDPRLELSSRDILSLQRVPHSVVLSGCELARAEPTRHVAALGMGQAFILQGADRVVAPVRPVADALAGQFSELLYRRGPSTLRDLDSAVADAQLELARTHPDWDWAAFRVWGP
ncbi:MAG: CHAT domain-containing protein [Myxococcota bacterium]